MGKWLSQPVTPPGFDFALVLIAGLFWLVVAAASLAYGRWRFGGMFTGFAAYALLCAWLYYRRRHRPAR
jgi:membrane protein implicated in regulation of membrane protease activity